MKSRVVWCDAGWMPVHYGFCSDEAAWRRTMRHHKIDKESEYPPDDGNTSLLESIDGGDPIILVTLNKSMDKAPIINAISLIVHEAMHVWRRIREVIGEHDPSKEFEAYAIQNITAQLLRAYNDTRRNIR